MIQDLEHLNAWKEKYDTARRHFVGGFMERITAIDVLRSLRFRDDALKIELLEWTKERDARADREKAERRAEQLRAKLREYNDKRDATPPSSV